jgi:hypothetical protein
MTKRDLLPFDFRTEEEGSTRAAGLRWRRLSAAQGLPVVEG